MLKIKDKDGPEKIPCILSIYIGICLKYNDKERLKINDLKYIPYINYIYTYKLQYMPYKTIIPSLPQNMVLQYYKEWISKQESITRESDNNIPEILFFQICMKYIILW